MHENRSAILGEQKAGLVARKAQKGDTPTAGLGAIAIKRQETRITNQRLEDRHRNVVEDAQIVFRRRRLPVAVVNVSSRGAMLAAEIEPRIGEKLDILFTPDNRTKCAVRWIREGRVGVEFLEETIFWETGGTGPVFRYEPASGPDNSDEAPQDERALQDREPRQSLLRAGTLYWSGVSVPVRLRNISGHGARVEADRPLEAGCEVELDLGEAGFRTAEIRWARDGQIGLHFSEAFDLDSLTPSPLATERPPDVLKPAYLETELRPDSPWAARFERLSVTELKLVGKR
jgi:hypothetical protein